MNKRFRSWRKGFSPAFVLAFIGCSVGHAQEVRCNYLPGTDFSKYRTYSWMIIGGIGHPDQILDAEIKQSIDSQLQAKGFTTVDSGTPASLSTAGLPQPTALPQVPGFPQPPDTARAADSTYKTDVPDQANSASNPELLISYQVAIKRETQWNGFGSFDRFPGSGFGTATGTATSSMIPVGTLMVDIYDRATKRLLWEGFATKTISLSKDQQKNQKNLDKVVQKLMKDFPPRER